MSDQQDTKDITNVTTRCPEDPAHAETGDEPDVASIERIYRYLHLLPHNTYQTQG